MSDDNPFLPSQNPAPTPAPKPSDDVPADLHWLGPVNSFFYYHVVDNVLFWLGLVIMALLGNEAWASSIYNWLSATPLGTLFQAAYEWSMAHKVFWLGALFVGFSIFRSYIKMKVTRFVIESGVLIVTRGKFTLNPFCFFQRNDYTVALNLIYDVDVNKTLFQYIFGGGDVYVRTASQDVFHLEFVVDPHKLRAYLLEHSGIKNKPVIGIY